MSKTVSAVFSEDTEDKLQEIKDAFSEDSTSHVLRRIIDEYYQDKNSYHYLKNGNN